MLREQRPYKLGIKILESRFVLNDFRSVCVCVFLVHSLVFFPSTLVEGLLNFRRRVCRSFWLDLAFQDPTPRKRTVKVFLNFPQGVLHRREDVLNRGFSYIEKSIAAAMGRPRNNTCISQTLAYANRGF